MSNSHSPSALPNRLIRRFTAVAVGLLLLWFFGYERTLAIDGRLDKLLCSNIATSAAAVLRVVGFNAQAGRMQPQMLFMGEHAAVWVGPGCNGLVLYALFAGFVLAYPGRLSRKAWYIPAGMVLIYGLNVLRVAVLALNHEYYPRSLDFNHHYTFTTIVYACIFGLWMLWAQWLAPLSPAAVWGAETIKKSHHL